MEWLNQLLQKPEIQTALGVLFLALITALTVAVNSWTANRKALDITTEVIERKRETQIKRAVESGQKTIRKSASKALDKSVIRAEAKNGKVRKIKTNGVQI